MLGLILISGQETRSRGAAVESCSSRDHPGEGAMVEQSGPVETAVVMVSGWRLWVHNVIEAPTLGQSLLRRHLITE